MKRSKITQAQLILTTASIQTKIHGTNGTMDLNRITIRATWHSKTSIVSTLMMIDPVANLNSKDCPKNDLFDFDKLDDFEKIQFKYWEYIKPDDQCQKIIYMNMSWISMTKTSNSLSQSANLKDLSVMIIFLQFPSSHFFTIPCHLHIR